MIREIVTPLAAEIQYVIAARRISQNEFARRAGVHDSILSRLMNNKVTAEPSLKKVERYLRRERRALARIA